jgi:hypothetical protein
VKKLAATTEAAGAVDEEAIKALIAEHSPAAATGGLDAEAVAEMVEERLMKHDEAGGGVSALQVDELVEGRIKMELERALASDDFVARVAEQAGAGAVDADAVAEIVDKRVKQAAAKLAKSTGPDAGAIRSMVQAEVNDKLSPDLLEAMIIDLVPSQPPAAAGGGGADEADVKRVVTEALVERLAKFQSEVLPGLVEKAVASAAPAAGAAADGGDVSAAKAYADEKTAELEAKVIKALKAQASSGAIEVTPDLVNSIANSDSFLKMLENRFRVMAEYLKTDVIPREFRNLSGKG